MQLAGGLGLALLLNQRGIKLKRFWQALLIIPWAIPEFVGALTWSQVFDQRFGWLVLAGQQWNQQAPSVINFATSWQENMVYAVLVLLTAATWFGVPFMFLAATAGLKIDAGRGIRCRGHRRRRALADISEYHLAACCSRCCCRPSSCGSSSPSTSSTCS